MLRSGDGPRYTRNLGARVSGYAVTRDARHDTRYGGRLGREEKARANRRNRRWLRVDLGVQGEDALLIPKLYTGWDVI